ncbi:HK97-gp10 family putative phage morphogenesis protein [Halomonas colorata]|uniref:HK97-gp10 family putative phage morphogenesis protein n=1 Tax=Halomonas colorata TaxID=2742615 RepID=UPI001867D52B|nr:HK97-gp10 family putative phage morphogenesis protein [Halomonas colorata]
MTDPVALNVDGLEPLLARMDNIGYDLRKKGGRFAMRKAANLIRDRARQNAQAIDDPSTANSIADNIVVRFSPKDFRQRGDLVFRVGVLGGAKGYAAASGEVKGKGKENPGGDTYYWRFIEFGRGPVKAPEGENLANAQSGEFFGGDVGPAPAQPFMRRALSENIQDATNEFINQYNKSLDRALKKQAREAGA